MKTSYTLFVSFAHCRLTPVFSRRLFCNGVEAVMNVFHAYSRIVAHERFSALMDNRRFQVVYPVLPLDLLVVYVLLPE